MTLEQKIKVALSITPLFEGKGYDQVTGNFDGMGISLGCLQWNIGMGSLQEKILKPYVAKFGKSSINKMMPGDLEVLLSVSPKMGVAYCQKMLHVAGSNRNLKPEWKAALQKFLLLPETIELQQKAAHSVGVKAEKMAKFIGLDSIRVFCWCFDVVTQNGSLKLNYLPEPSLSVARGIALGALVGDKNKKIWATALKTASQESLTLFIMSYQRAQLARSQYQADVMSRKGTIALGIGYVHGRVFTFPQLEAK